MASDRSPGAGGGTDLGATDATGVPDDEWRRIIRTERQRVRLTQAQLAARAGLAVDTIRKYEHGSRLPSRENLERILEVLQVPVSTVRQAMLSRGFHHPGFHYPPDRELGYYFTEAELQTFVNEVPWPQFVANELGEIVACNRPMQVLWEIDLTEELARRSSTRANLLVAMAEPRFFERLANWEEVCGHFVGLYKAVPASRGLLDEPGALFSEVIAAFAAANPAALPVLFRIWQSTPRRGDKVRWSYPVVWREPGFAEMRFLGVVNPASEPDKRSFNDWIPADAASHATLETLLTSRSGRAADSRTARRRPRR